jgi:hypothetical protein
VPFTLSPLPVRFWSKPGHPDPPSPPLLQFVRFPLPTSIASLRDSLSSHCHSSPLVSTTLSCSSDESEPRHITIDLAQSYRTPSEGSPTTGALVAVGSLLRRRSSATSSSPCPYSKSPPVRSCPVCAAQVTGASPVNLIDNCPLEDCRHTHQRAVQVRGDHALGRVALLGPAPTERPLGWVNIEGPLGRCGLPHTVGQQPVKAGILGQNQLGGSGNPFPFHFMV